MAPPIEDTTERDRAVKRTLFVEGSVNVAAVVAKSVVGVSTGSVAVLADALHSLADVANNVVAYVVMHFAAKPPDRNHPYGHRKFETLAVFALATVLTVTAIEIVLHAFRSGEREVEASGAGLVTMLVVLVAQILVATWESHRARKFDSDILRADARHTFSDILVTAIVIGGWQWSARGPAWIDTALTIVVALIVLYFAFGLFRSVVPVLVDESAHDPDKVRNAAVGIDGVESVRSVRSRWVGSKAAIDIVVTVSPEMPATEAHDIADAVERLLGKTFSAAFVNVHIEPSGAPE